jgi:hypothetical protein
MEPGKPIEIMQQTLPDLDGIFAFHTHPEEYGQ